MSKPKATHAFTYPPFPRTPGSTSITPFENFQERGIQIQLLGDEGEELDGTGQPTVALRNRHDNNKIKTDAKPRPAKPAEVAFKKADGSVAVRRKEWWEEWEDNDRFRTVGGYNPNEARSDRFHKATGDFNRNRRWPPMHTGVRAQWDQFQLFAGLLTSIPTWNKKRANDPDDDSNESDSDFDDGGEDMPPAKSRYTHIRKVDETPVDAESGDRPYNKFKKRPRPHEPYGKDGNKFGCKPTPVENDDQIRELIDSAKEDKDDKLVAFLNDTEKRRVLPDKEEEASLKRAKAVAELALQELPLTSRLAKAIPDDFNRALSVFFEIRKEQKVWPTAEDIEANQDAQTQPASKDERSTAAPDAKRVKLTTENGEVVDGQEDNVQQTLVQELVEDGKLEVIGEGVGNPGTGGTAFGDAEMAESTAQSSGLADSVWASASTGGWGDGSSWGDGGVSSSTNGWGNTTTEEADAAWGTNKNLNAWDSTGDANEPQWYAVNPTLFPLLGPTTLPMTHRTGIVEWSVRRVKKITPPDPSPIPSKPIETKNSELEYGSVLAVESELLHRLYKVEMEPWLGWADSSHEEEGVLPRIYESSRGKVVIQNGVFFDRNSKEKVGVESKKNDDGMDVDSVDRPSHVYTPSSGLKPFKALEDTITLLMEQSSVEHLRVGMGLGGTWVQLLRNGDIEGDLGLDNRVKPKTKGKTSGHRYWYIDELMITLTSYHTV
ncbi:hypothetical protein V5O48_005891 [Marasmius crinis-equi]|uniref:Uncharacterized protein n=1 Tax=Marasmius crinis-equi TaxID=585013 RepID=A0ABR3FLP4_9AGAR